MRSRIASLTVLLTAAIAAPTQLHAAGTESSTPPQQAVYTASLGDSYVASLADDDTYTASLADQERDDRSMLTAFAENAFDRTNFQFGLTGHSTCESCGESKGGKGGKGCGCGGGRGLFASFDFLQWYSKDRRFPALVTTSPPGTPPADAGELTTAGTQILFGGNDIGGDRQAAGRLTVGLWLDDCQQRALVFRAYANEGEDEAFVGQSNGNPILALPYFDAGLASAEAAFLIAYPGLFTGNISATAKTDVVGGDIFLRSEFRSSNDYRIDWLAGYQFNRIDDDLVRFASTNGAGVTTTLLDVFDVRNEFHGGEIGFVGEFYRDCWTLSVLGKVAIGNMQQRAAISGNYTTTGGGGRMGPGGLLAQPTNIGVYERDVAVWSPEAEIKLSYAVNDQLSLSVGYTALYWNRVALAGDLIDRNVNGAQILNGGLPFAPPNVPAFVWRDTDYWAQAISVGMDYTY